MLLHHASAETLEAKADAEDMLTTRNTFDEQPSGTLAYDDAGVSVELGSSPPSFSYLMSRKASPISTSCAPPAICSVQSPRNFQFAVSLIYGHMNTITRTLLGFEMLHN